MFKNQQGKGEKKKSWIKTLSFLLLASPYLHFLVFFLFFIVNKVKKQIQNSLLAAPYTRIGKEKIKKKRRGSLSIKLCRTVIQIKEERGHYKGEQKMEQRTSQCPPPKWKKQEPVHKTVNNCKYFSISSIWRHSKDNAHDSPAAEALSNTERNLPIDQIITSVLNINMICQSQQLSVTFTHRKFIIMLLTFFILDM